MADNIHNRKLKRAAKPRIRRILKLRASGKTWQAIGDMMGITKQRAQALAAKGA